MTRKKLRRVSETTLGALADQGAGAPEPGLWLARSGFQVKRILSWVSSGLRICCNGPTLSWEPMAAAIYLALVGGGLVAAIAASLVLRGIKLI